MWQQCEYWSVSELEMWMNEISHYKTRLCKRLYAKNCTCYTYLCNIPAIRHIVSYTLEIVLPEADFKERRRNMLCLLGQKQEISTKPMIQWQGITLKVRGYKRNLLDEIERGSEVKNLRNYSEKYLIEEEEEVWTNSESSFHYSSIEEVLSILAW